LNIRPMLGCGRGRHRRSFRDLDVASPFLFLRFSRLPKRKGASADCERPEAICGSRLRPIFGESSSGAARRAYAIRARELSLSPLFSSWKFRQELSGFFLSAWRHSVAACHSVSVPLSGRACH
jgi:hypothetical protein